jgi:hypothetical protein
MHILMKNNIAKANSRNKAKAKEKWNATALMYVCMYVKEVYVVGSGYL